MADPRPAPSAPMGSEGDEFLARLPAAVQRWQAQGIISAEQGREMISAYRALGAPVAVHRTQGRLVTILSTLGSVLVGLGVILFFAANWGEVKFTPEDAVPCSEQQVVELLQLILATREYQMA